MRIGFDITALYMAQAGVFYYDYNLIRALLEQDPDSEYLLLDYYPIHGGWTDPPEALEWTAPNARVVHCHGLRHRQLARWAPLQKPRLLPLAALADKVLYWPWTMATEAVMRRRLIPVLDGVNVFHSSDVLLWKQPGALNVVTLYDLTALLFPERHTADTREFQWRKYRFAQHQADAVLAISEATRQDIVTHLGIPPDRVHVVYGGVDPIFRPIEDRRALAWTLASLKIALDKYLLFVGTLEPRKNLVRLIEAYHQLRHRLPPPAPRLVMVGASGWQFEAIFERVETLNLEKEVMFLGRVPYQVLPALYNGAVAFVYPSLYEGFGLPPLEAMRCGTPVITSNCSSLPEVVGDAGRLVDPLDVDGLASAMVEVVSDADLRADMRRRGLAQAARFSWERTARETLAVYAAARA